MSRNLAALTTGQVARSLRATTRSDHHGLDHHPLLAPLVRADLTLADYTRALAALHAPQATCENRVGAWLKSIGKDRDFPPRTPDLAADLQALGASACPLNTAGLPETTSVAAHLGVMYVLEGSLLGARVIGRVLAEQLPRCPRRYFTVPETEGNLRWQQFLALCEQIGESQEAEAIHAARQTFQLFKAHLDNCAQQLNVS